MFSIGQGYLYCNAEPSEILAPSNQVPVAKQVTGMKSSLSSQRVKKHQKQGFMREGKLPPSSPLGKKGKKNIPKLPP